MKKIILVFLMAGLFISCGESNKKNAPEIKTVSSGPVKLEPVGMNAKFEKPEIAMAYKYYHGIKTGLADSDAKKTQMAAKKLFETLEKAEFNDRMKKTALGIAETDNLEKQRKAFQKLTAQMIEVVKGGLASGELYYQYCPMAFGGEGAYWISNGKEIRNPYYGQNMLKCGEVRAVIK